MSYRPEAQNPACETRTPTLSDGLVYMIEDSSRTVPALTLTMFMLGVFSGILDPVACAVCIVIAGLAWLQIANIGVAFIEIDRQRKEHEQ